MNRHTIIGRIGNDAEIKDFGGNQVINFSVAVTESYNNKQTGEKVVNTTWIECSKWGNNTAIAQYLTKGTQILVEGKPNNRAYVKDDGTVVVVNGINVQNIMLLGSKNDSAQTQQQKHQHAGEQFTDPNFNPNGDFDENDPPF